MHAVLHSDGSHYPEASVSDPGEQWDALTLWQQRGAPALVLAAFGSFQREKTYYG